MEFQGPIVESVAYTSGSQTVNITYTAVSNIELRNPNGFEVYEFSFSRCPKNFRVCFRFAVLEVIAQMILYGFHHLYQIRMD